MIEEVALSIFKVEVPMPRNPLKSVNSYILKDHNRHLIVDTGMNLPEARDVLLTALKKLDVDLENSDFFITHFHVDHLELAVHLADKNSKIFLNRTETALLNSAVGWEAYRAFFLKHGYPDNELKKMEANSMTAGYISGRFRLDYHQVKENDCFRIGDYSFCCLDTAGHSPGHMCLYEPAKKILICGDNVLFDITPNITSWPSLENALQEYLINLDKIYPLEVNLVLPGHRSIWSNHRQRILELKEHHRVRANEILMALDRQGKSAYEIAPRISWDVSYSSWDEFPAPQKFFAVGEVIAHLRYLEGEGVITSKPRDGVILFYPR